jgi:predicted Zn-dependent peptidase
MDELLYWRMMKIELTKLKNGMKVVIVPMEAPSVTVLAMVRVGSRNEIDKEAGITHFLEHMVFKGTKSFKTAKDLSMALDRVGADYNAYTSKEYTGYWAKVPSEYLELGLQIVGEMVTSPRLPSLELEREKGVILEEIKMYEDMPMKDVGSEFEKLLYKGRLGRRIIGSKKVIQDMDQKKMKDYMSQWYQPERVVLVVAGGISNYSKLFQIVPNYFKFKTSPLSEITSPEESFVEEKLIKIKKKKTEQAHLVVGWPVFGWEDERKFELQVWANLLGGTMSSRLFQEIREKRGLAYYVRSGVDLYQGMGSLNAQAGVEAKKEVVEKVVRLIKKELEREVSREELERAKENLKGSLQLAVEDSSVVAGMAGKKMLLENKKWSLEGVLKKIERVRVGEVKELAKEILKEKMRVALIGPFDLITI